MKRSTAFFFICSMTCATPSWSEIIEVPLPGLLGAYPITPYDGVRTTSFLLPQAPTVVNAAWFRISGNETVGEVICWLSEEPTLHPWPMDYTALMPAENGAWLVGLGTGDFPLPESGPFTRTKKFFASPYATTWSFLLDGAGEITLSGHPASLVGLCYGEVSAPSAVVDEAVLIVDAEFAVPVAESTWGRIKALYR